MLRNNTSGYKGVSWNKRKGKWRATITVNRKPLFLGYFGTPEEAAGAYDQAAIRHFGEYAVTNEMLSPVAVGETGAWQHHAPVEQTHCRRANHEYTPENTYILPSGARVCRECTRERRRKARQARPRTSKSCPPGCTCGRHRRKSPQP
jgi:hypothetical protein